jgi:nucleotide-binding universal stress UspA family protein
MAAENEPVLENSGDEIEVIVVAVDGTAGATRVISTAARLSRAVPAAEMHIVHVFPTHRFDRARAGVPVTNADFVEDAKEHLESFVRSARRQCRNHVTPHFVVGDPTAEILRLSAALKANLLVVGTHDHTGFERLLLGSVAETLMRKVGCSVLVVRPTSRGS